MADTPNNQAPASSGPIIHPMPNPFFDPFAFKAVAEDIVSKSNVRGSMGFIAMPNPFFDPHKFASKRLLTTQMIQSHVSTAPKQPEQSTQIENLNDPLSEPSAQVSDRPGNPFFNPSHFEATRIRLSNAWESIKEAVNDISVLAVASHLGGLPNQDGMANKIKIKGDNVLFNGQQWYNANADEGGVGPVMLLMAFTEIDKRDDAIKELAKIFKNEIGTEAIRANSSSAVREKIEFEAPENAPQFLNDIRHYLNKERGIDSALIERLIREGRVYADLHKNVVMIGKVGKIAELRGVEPYKDWRTDEWKTTKMLKPGSDKNSGSFLVVPDADKVKDGSLKPEKAFAFVEAGIDAMSYHMLFPGRAVASASGASFTYPRKVFFDSYTNNYSFHCAFDSDLAGDKASQNIYNSAALFHVFSKEYGITQEADFLNLFTSKTLRIKLRPELHVTEKQSEADDTEEDLTENVLFFNSENPFEDPSNPPKVKFQVKPNQLGIKTGHQEIVITPEMHKEILSKFKLHRDRPTNAKDWNDMVKPKSNNMPKYT